MPIIWWICLRARGRVISRTSTVNTMMAKPVLLKLMTYSTNRVLSMGRMISSLQRNPKASKEPYPFAASSRLITLGIFLFSVLFRVKFSVKAPRLLDLGAFHIDPPHLAILGPHEHRIAHREEGRLNFRPED